MYECQSKYAAHPAHGKAWPYMSAQIVGDLLLVIIYTEDLQAGCHVFDSAGGDVL